ncbi:MAG: ABC transporter permease [Planctomycetota bacterium]|jgi:ribose/xylose/arabinose/galactoside ABC-type transport system permease subunit|nr:ABC transporter permease [Planctomycetota bacterium]
MEQGEESAKSFGALAFGLLRHQVVSITAIMLVMWVILWQMSPHFLTVRNILEITLQASVTAVIAAGVSFVIYAGMIDLSVGSIFAMAAVGGGLAYHAANNAQWGTFPGVAASLLATVAIGGIAGLVNGLSVVYLRIPAFVATLGMMGIARGIGFIICDGVPIYGLPKAYTEIGQGKFGPIPYPTIITIALFLVFFVILRNTRFGRFTYAIGSNAEASRLSGIKVNFMIPVIFVICGACAALASIIEAARLGTMQPNGGQGYELQAIGAVYIGGASISGGEGHILGSLIGAILVTTIRNGLNILGVSAFWQLVVNGLIIIFAVAADQIRKRR